MALAAVLLWAVAPRLRRGHRAPERPAEQHYRMGLALARAGDAARAVGEWKLAIAIDPIDARPYDALDRYYEATGQPALGAQILAQLARANPTAGHRDCRFARAAFAAGWITQAGAAADRAVREEPTCPLAHAMRGIVLDDAGEPAEALAELAKAHQLSPGDERIALTLAQIEGRSGRRAAALQHVAQVLKQDPASPQAHYLMGWLAARAAPPTPAADAEAARQLRQALALNPQDAAALAELGALDARRGQFANARPLLEAAARQNLTDPGIARSLAMVYAHLRDPRAARLAAVAGRLEQQQQRRRALRRRHLAQPGDAAVTLQLARLELSQGQTQEASDLASQVLHANPDDRAALDLEQEIMSLPAAPASP